MDIPFQYQFVWTLDSSLEVLKLQRSHVLNEPLSKLHPTKHSCIQETREAHLADSKTLQHRSVHPKVPVVIASGVLHLTSILMCANAKSWSTFPSTSPRNSASWPPVRTERSARCSVAKQRPLNLRISSRVASKSHASLKHLEKTDLFLA